MESVTSIALHISGYTLVARLWSAPSGTCFPSLLRRYAPVSPVARINWLGVLLGKKSTLLLVAHAQAVNSVASDILRLRAKLARMSSVTVIADTLPCITPLKNPSDEGKAAAAPASRAARLAASYPRDRSVTYTACVVRSLLRESLRP